MDKNSCGVEIAEVEIDNGSLASLVLYAGGTLSVTLPRIQES